MARRIRADWACGCPVLVVVLGLWGCSVDRDRPTGLELNVPETRVEVTRPETEDLVPADSIVPVLVRASGLIQAVELVMRRGATRDTILRERQVLDEAQDLVETVFEIQIPGLETGAQLELLGTAENVLGERRDSPVVIVIVIDCEVFSVACAGL